MASKVVGVPLVRGERVLLETPGGGGYGAPEDRDPADLAADQTLGYVPITPADT